MLKNKLSGWMIGILGICLVVALSSCGTSKQMGCPSSFTKADQPSQLQPQNRQDYAINYNVHPFITQRLTIEK